MAQAKGLAEDCSFNGKLSDLVFYELDGKVIVRFIGKVSKHRYKNSPSFAALRDNQSEFGLSSQLGRVLRQSMRPYIQLWKMHNSSGLLTGAFRKAIQTGKGDRGKRSFEVSDLSFLDGVGLDPEKARLCAKQFMKLDRSKGEAYLRITYGRLQKIFSTAALPLSIKVGVIALSEVRYEDGYKVMHPDWHGQSVFNEGKVIDNWPESGELRLKANLGEVPEGVGLVGVFGVMAEVGSP